LIYACIAQIDTAGMNNTSANQGSETARVIGLIGGMSWESSAEYYKFINQEVRRRLGPLRSAKLLMYSVDFGPIEQAQRAGRWDELAGMLEDAAIRLHRGGADCVVLCTNTMHKVADRVAAAVPVPFFAYCRPGGAPCRAVRRQGAGPFGNPFHHGAALHAGAAGAGVRPASAGAG
jgi:aspartate racemase